jgi:hypothetical protein
MYSSKNVFGVYLMKNFGAKKSVLSDFKPKTAGNCPFSAPVVYIFAG